MSEAVKESPNIVRGRTGESYSKWDKSHQRIYTYTSFTVTEVLRGNLKETKILVRQPGGSADGMEMNVPGTASFHSDEDVVLLLGEHNSEDESYDVPGFTTGKYNVVNGPNGEPMLVNSLGGAAVYDPKKDTKTLSYNSSVPLEVFRRIAKGEDVPEASHHQYERSNKPAPQGAYEADHDRHSHTVPKASPSVKAPASDSSVEKPEEPKSNLWVPLSFAALAIIGGIIFFVAFRSRED